MSGATSGALANVDDDAIIAQIANGAYLGQIAAQLGVSKQAVSQRLAKNPNYRPALEHRYQAQLDDAQQAIEVAGDAIDIARARERFRAVAWRAEREFPARWGNRTQIEVTHDVSDRLGDALQRIALQQSSESQIIDGTVQLIDSQE